MVTEFDLPISRLLTAAEAMLVHQELRTTPNILGYTVSELRRWQSVQIFEVGGEMAGVCLIVELAEGWTELSALYVLPAFRGQGIGRRLFAAAVQKARDCQQNLCVLSRNPQVISWMQAEGLTVFNGLQHVPAPIRAHLRRHMAHPYRWLETMRKLPQIRRCPPLVYGILSAKKRQKITKRSDGSETRFA